MYSEPVIQTPPLKAMVKAFVMVGIIGFLCECAQRSGIAPTPLARVALGTFLTVICTTLFFWTHRVAVAFLAVAVLVGSRAVTLQGLMRAAELEIFLFLVGMMIIVGALKDLGLFTWIIQGIANKKRMTGTTFTVILGLFSAVLAGMIDEVSSIVIVLALVFQVCDTLKIKPQPFVLISVLCTNIGSAATMLGNPVGVFIGNKAGFTFGQFLTGATPVAAVALVCTLAVVLLWFRKSIAEMTVRLEELRKQHLGLGPLIRIPHRRGLFVLTFTVAVVSCHHLIEDGLGLPAIEGNRNAFLLITPLVIAGLLMIYRPQRARHYVEREVEWWTLLFFMLLFAVAGGLHEQGISQNIADRVTAFTTSETHRLMPLVLTATAVCSAFIDNIVSVAAFKPVLQALTAHTTHDPVLWWALLFGACFGGNITIVGSTANIVALGLLEKRGQAAISFFEWLKIGLVIGVLSGLVAWGMLSVLPMPKPLGTFPDSAAQPALSVTPTPAP